MKKAPTTGQDRGAFVKTEASEYSTAKRAINGIRNPRQLRVLRALLLQPMSREQLDREAGCSNAPALVAALRARGIEISCRQFVGLDSDGRRVRRGVYELSGRLAAFIAVRNAGKR